MKEIVLMTKVEWLRDLRESYKTLIFSVLSSHISSDTISEKTLKRVKKMKGKIRAINYKIKSMLYN